MSRSMWMTGLGIVLTACFAGKAEDEARPERRSRSDRFDSRKYMLLLPSGIAAQTKDRLKTDDSQNQTIDTLAKEFDEKILQLRKEFAERCAQTLTPEQREGFEKLIKAEEQQRAESSRFASSRSGSMRDDPRIFRFLARRLDFTDQQNQQMETILKQYEAGLPSLGGNEEAVRQFNQQTSDQLRALLTPEQKERMESMRQGRSRSSERPAR
jgi:Spy/CpxP family protein refolding chaperone